MLGTGGGSSCPIFIIEETSSKEAGFHFAGDVVSFKISTIGNAPWPADAEVRIIDNARFSGKNSNIDDGFRLKGNLYVAEKVNAINIWAGQRIGYRFCAYIT